MMIKSVPFQDIRKSKHNRQTFTYTGLKAGVNYNNGCCML